MFIKCRMRLSPIFVKPKNLVHILSLSQDSGSVERLMRITSVICPSRIHRGRSIGTPLFGIKCKPVLNIIFDCELDNITVSFLQKSTENNFCFDLLYFVLFSAYFHCANFFKCNSKSTIELRIY